MNNPKHEQIETERLPALEEVINQQLQKQQQQVCPRRPLNFRLLKRLLVSILAFSTLVGAVAYLPLAEVLPFAIWAVIFLSLLVLPLALFSILKMANRAGFTSAWERIKLSTLRRTTGMVYATLALIALGNGGPASLLAYAMVLMLTFEIHRELRGALLLISPY